MNQFSDSGAVMPVGDVSPIEHDEATKMVLRALAEHGIKAVTTVAPDALKPTTVMVGITVEAASMMHAQSIIHMALTSVKDGDTKTTPHFIEWWMAEDERYDGTDNDSAVCVPIGRQAAFQDFVHEAMAITAKHEQDTPD